MAFTGEEKHEISREDATKLINNSRKKLTAQEYDKAKRGGFFGRKAIEKLLAQKGCVGIRYYFAEHDDDTPDVVLVGVGKDQKDLSKSTYLEASMPCPPYC